jgi:hypothetical protein
LRYDEPPGWLIPVRHSLGANLIQAGRFTKAERVYREDLARLPENGRALLGPSYVSRAKGRRRWLSRHGFKRCGPRQMCRSGVPASAGQTLPVGDHQDRGLRAALVPGLKR